MFLRQDKPYISPVCFVARGKLQQGTKYNIDIKKRIFISPAQPIYFSKIDDCHFDRIHSFLTAVRCFHNGGTAASSLKRILSRVLLKRTQGQHG